MRQEDSPQLPETICCRLLRHALTNAEFPLVYDAFVEEVQLRLEPIGGIAVVRWCPFCGQSLDSGRSKLFTAPTQDDRNDVVAQLRGLSSLEQVVAKLGAPDMEGTGCGVETRPWAKWIRYSNRWGSLAVTVGEFPEGGISWSYGGRYIGKQAQ